MDGKKLKELRKQRKLTQQKLSEILDVDLTTIGKWEIHNATPQADTLKQLADYFNVSIDYLMGRENASPSPALEIPDNLQEARIAFYGGVEGLKQEDIDKVAEYIEFLKSKGQ